MIEKSIIIIEYIEANCPYCRYVEYSILRDIIATRDLINRQLASKKMIPLPILELKLIDVEANAESKEGQWFRQYSGKIGGEYTPAIRIEGSDKVYYLWGKKGISPTKKEISSAGKLKSDLIMEMQNVLSKVDRVPRYYDKEMYNTKNQNYIPNFRMRYMPYGGFKCQENSI